MLVLQPLSQFTTDMPDRKRPKDHFRSVAVLFLVALSTMTSCRGATEVTCSITSECECEQDNGRLVLNCKFKNLANVPTFTPSDVTIDELTLADNDLTSLPASSFNGLVVRRLDVTGNQLTDIADGAFHGLENSLEELLLQLHQDAVFPVAALAPLTRLRLLKVIGYGKAALPPKALESLTSLQELSIQQGQLKTIGAADLLDQRSTLSTLDLCCNHFEFVPTDALSTLTNLSTLELNQNNIAVIGDSAFGSASTLRHLTLSQNPISVVDQNAFRGLGSSLQNLSMQSCRLQDVHLTALRSLRSLRDLGVAWNELTSVDTLIAEMSSLEVLNAMSNRIERLSRSTYRAASSSLRYINLASNPLINVATDTFIGLVFLEELHLDGARLRLDADSFLSQRSTLRVLSLKNADLTDSVWAAITGLMALEKLVLSQCSLPSLADFPFSASSRLQVLDLDNNAIETVSPRSLAGLHYSLKVITLNGNRLTTLDRCVFDQFTNIDILGIGLANNPLRCDCRLQWLYEQLKPFHSDFRFDTLQWRCDNNTRLFNTLTDADFASCNQMTSAAPCENLIPTTAPPITYPVDPSIQINTTTLSADSILIVWSTTLQNVVSMTVTYQRRGSNIATRLAVPDVSVQEYELSGLDPNTTYIICLEAKTESTSRSVSSCTEASTAAGTKVASVPLELILGVSIGCGVAIILIIIITVVCLVQRKQHRRQSTPVTTAPKQSFQTKRFRKPGHYEERTSNSMANVTDADVDRAIVETVDRLDPESKEALKNLLRSASAASLDRLGGPSSYVSRGGFYHPRTEYTERHEYEELPDDTYDCIPTDDTV